MIAMMMIVGFGGIVVAVRRTLKGQNVVVVLVVVQVVVVVAEAAVLFVFLYVLDSGRISLKRIRRHVISSTMETVVGAESCVEFVVVAHVSEQVVLLVVGEPIRPPKWMAVVRHIDDAKVEKSATKIKRTPGTCLLLSLQPKGQEQ